jgi:hypothetical protein
MAADIGYVFLIGFASVRLTELYKEITLRIGLHQPPWWKAAVNLLCCALLVLLVANRSGATRVLLVLAASGVAMLLHAGDTVLRHYRDEIVSEVLARRSTRRR